VRGAAGGKAANVAYFVRRLGYPVRLIGCIGRDHYSDVAVGPLEEIGIDLYLHVTEQRPTGVAIVAVPENGEKLIWSAPNANMHLDSEYLALVRASIGSAPSGSFLVCDFEISPEILGAAFGAAEERGFDILVDTTFAEQVDKRDLSRFRVATPNQQEAAELLEQPVQSRDDAVAAAKALHSAGVEIACVKLDEGGAAVEYDGGSDVVNAPDVQVRDKTGAGDAFIAAMAIALQGGAGPLDAIRHGVAASSISVGTVGAQASYPTKDEFARMLARVGGSAKR
jgi:ribokinase